MNPTTDILNQSLPPLPGQEEPVLSTLDTSKGVNKRKRFSRLFVFSLVTVSFVLVGGVFLYNATDKDMDWSKAVAADKVIDALNSKDLTRSQERLLPAASAIPKQELNDLSTIIDDQVDDLSNQDQVKEDSIINTLVVRLAETAQQIDQFTLTVNERLTDLDGRIDALNAILVSEATLKQDFEKSLADIKTELSAMNKLATQPPSKTNQDSAPVVATPPKILSSAVWQGRDAVLIQPKNAVRIQFFYEGDVIDQWRIDQLTHHQVVWRSLDTQSIVTVKTGA